MQDRAGDLGDDQGGALETPPLLPRQGWPFPFLTLCFCVPCRSPQWNAHCSIPHTSYLPQPHTHTHTHTHTRTHIHNLRNRHRADHTVLLLLLLSHFSRVRLCATP